MVILFKPQICNAVNHTVGHDPYQLLNQDSPSQHLPAVTVMVQQGPPLSPCSTAAGHNDATPKERTVMSREAVKLSRPARFHEDALK